MKTLEQLKAKLATYQTFAANCTEEWKEYYTKMVAYYENRVANFKA